MPLGSDLCSITIKLADTILDMKKELYERLTAWMADYEDSSLLEETMPAEDITSYLMDCAFDIMYDIHLEELAKEMSEEEQLMRDGQEYWN